MQKINIFWFRRDLRLSDNAGLYHALKSDYPVLPLFIFDKNILDKLPEQDARVDFIHQTITDLAIALKEKKSALLVKYGAPEQIWATLLKEYQINAVYTNRDYEEYALGRDEKITALVEQDDGSFHTFKDHVLFEKGEILKKDGTPYTVFTPYSRKWKEKLGSRLSLIHI